MAGAGALDYSQTQRIVLLIDLNPLLHLQNPSPYLNSILKSAKTLLSFQSLSQSLSSFKLFFSSLSPLLSSSTLLNLPNKFHSNNSNTLSFDRPQETLISLSQTLDSLSKVSESIGLDNRSACSLTASSMFQIVHDYAWEMQFDDPLGMSGDELIDFDSKSFVRSNLVVMFSSICRSLGDFYDYMGLDRTYKFDGFDNEFIRAFGHVKDAFVCRDIHFSWVDVRYEVERDKGKTEIDEAGNVAKLFANGIKNLGWGFSSTDSLVLGSALVPFGLIYPIIGVPPKFYSINNGSCKPNWGQLNLGIVDVNGKPLECKYCDIQLQSLKRWCKNVPYEISHKPEATKSEVCESNHGDVFSKIDVMAVRKSDEFFEMEKSLCDVVLIQELIELKKSEKSSKEFFADRILEMLMEGTDKSGRSKSVPLWEILLSFLDRGGYWALVSLSNPDGSSFLGILKPFTIHSAHLCIMQNSSNTHNPFQFVREVINGTGSAEVSAQISCGTLGGDSRRKNKKRAQNYKDLTWRAFYKDVFEGAKMELEEAYIFLRGNNSKKLKFLKCWMKQVIKLSQSDPCKPELPKTRLESLGRVEDRLNRIEEESEQPLSSPCAAAEEALPQTEDATYASLSEAPAAFFSNLSLRIQEGLESGLDLVALAQRIVSSSIHWLNQMPEVRKKDDASSEISDDNEGDGTLTAELVNALLKDPKVLASQHHDKELDSRSCGTEPVKYSSKNKVRECELQVLFRMEILQSGVGTRMKEKMKQRFVKQICMLLEIIQCNKEEGFFGDFNLNDYVQSIIKSRYSHSLADVIDNIYKQMDLWLFDDEDENPISLLNSEDSSQSGRDYMFKEETGENDGISNLPAEDSFPIALGAQNSREEHTCRLVAAQEKRQRALRFTSYTRGMPDLQRVWAPKQPKLSRLKLDSLQKRSRTKDGRRQVKYDKVCETPLTGNKRSCLARRNTYYEHPEQRSSSSGSVCKALFQDEL